VAEAEKAVLSSLTPLTILLVEDSPEDRAVYQRFLRQHLPAATVCLEATTGTEGLRLCQTTRLDCIILDMRLPDMTGLEFLQARQAGSPTPPCPVILLTGQGNEQLAVQALHAGAQDYVVKHDLSAALLYQTITQAVERFRRRQAQEAQWHTLRQQNLRLREHEEHLTTLATTLEQQVVERTALLELLQDITRAANEATESAEALQFAVDHLCAYTGWPVGHVYLAAAPDMTRWAPTAIWHLAAPGRFTAFQQATQSVEFANGEGLVGRVGALGKAEWSADITADSVFHRWRTALEVGLTAGVAVPILAGPEVAGVLEFYTDTPLPPNLPLLETITQIGTQLGRVVERERTAAQLQQQQEALIQREKLAAMGSLLASVAHELNNPLAIITMQASNLREELGMGPPAEMLADITQAADRCKRLVQNFLTLAHQHPPERLAVDLNALITRVLELLTPSLRDDNIAVQAHLDAALPLLWADAHQLQQVVINLMTNAQQALREVATPRQLTLRTRHDPSRMCVTCEVADTGPGIPPALRERIFEPFFTTKPPGIGTGLGLSLCQGILAGHGGTIRVTGAPGQGATFSIELPAAAETETAPVPPDLKAPALLQGQTILVVDDELSLTRALARLLRRDGHTVDIVANGRLALDQLRERAYDLILSDWRMPELDGPGLYQALAQQYPHLQQRFVVLTGNTLSPETLAFSAQHGVPQLTKPFTASEVRRIIQQVLSPLPRSHPRLPAPGGRRKTPVRGCKRI
jgi:signal transduction histidine kinase/DNA-binding response OmpR family regulator